MVAADAKARRSAVKQAGRDAGCVCRLRAVQPDCQFCGWRVARRHKVPLPGGDVRSRYTERIGAGTADIERGRAAIDE